MKHPSDSEIEAAKKSAAAQGVKAHLLTYEDIDVAIIVHAMTPREWANYVDAAQRNATDAQESVYADSVVWPTATEADALTSRIPALATLVVRDVLELAGWIIGDPELTKLTAETPVAKLARAGLSREKANDLLLKYNQPGQLTLARWPTLDMSEPGRGFACVVKTPSKAIFRARLDVYNKAKADCSGVWDCATQCAIDIIVWTSEGESPNPFFARWPGAISGDMVRLFERVGGANAKAQRREL
jgi:hypothetical protein